VLAYDETAGEFYLKKGDVNPIDKPPTSPSAWDDEFNGASLNSKWTRLRSSNGNINLNNGLISLSYTSSGTDNGTAIVKAPPSGDFILTTSLKEHLGIKNYSCAGIILSESLTDDTQLYMFGIGYDSAPKIRITRLNNLGSWKSNPLGNTFGLPYGYLRISRVGTTLNFYYSLNGSLFKQIHSMTSAFTIGGIGLLVQCSVAGTIADGVFDWFRVVEI